MIALVEGARRQKTPNEIALTIPLSALTLIFLLVCVTLVRLVSAFYSGAIFFRPGFDHRAARLSDPGSMRSADCLLGAIGIAGMDRVPAAECPGYERDEPSKRPGDVDVLLCSIKTETITLGNRMAAAITPCARHQTGRSRCLSAAELTSPTKRRRADPSSSWRRRSLDCVRAK